MANYGPPGGGFPEPWGGRRPDDAYGPAPEPRPGTGWGKPTPGRPQPSGAPGQPYPPYDGQAYPPYGGQPGHPPYAPPGYPPAGPYEPVDRYRSAGPEAYAGDPAPKRGRGRLIAGLAALAVLLLGGVGILVYLFGPGDDGTPAAGPGAPTASAGASAEVPAPVGPAPTTPAPASSSDPRFVKAGQCVRNEGAAGGKPKLSISGCAPKTYEVLRRFDGATSGEKDAEAKCAKVTGYTNWYFFDSELDTLDFVLCLRQR